jgi:chromosome partitioning protein
LICDFDLQASASIWLLRLERWNKINAAGEGAVSAIVDSGRGM